MPERGSKTSTVPVVWATFGILSALSKWFPGWRDWWPWTKPGYITMTRRQSNKQTEWRHSGLPPSPPQKKIRVQKFAGKVRASIFRYQDGILLNFHRAKLPTRSITHLCWCNWRTFWRKNAAGKSPRRSCSCTTMLRLTGPCNPEGTGLLGLPMSSSPTLFSGSGPVGLPPVPWTENPIERSPFFVRRGGQCCRGDLVGWTTFWFFF